MKNYNSITLENKDFEVIKKVEEIIGRALKHEDLQIEDSLYKSIFYTSNRKIIKLIIWHNFEEFPLEILQLDNLKVLGLFETCITQIPDNISKLSELEILYIDSECDFESLPTSIGDFKHLSELSIGSPALKSIPPTIVELKKIERLNIGKLTHFPISILELESLKTLILQKNLFENIPSEISNLKNLEYLDLSFCNLKSLPEDLGKLKSLKILYLNNNNFSNLPESILELKNLELLDLRSNYISKEDNILKLLKENKIRVEI